MKKELKEKVDLFLKNKKEISENFKYETDISYLMSSFLYTDINEAVDLNKLLDSRKILIEKSRVFSDYRFLDLLLSTKMSLSQDPLKYFESIDELSKKMNIKMLFGSIYSILSSIIINDFNAGTKSIEKILEKEKYIYEKINKMHPFLTGAEDIPFIILLSLSDKDSDKIINDIEENYNILKDKIKGSKNDIYTVAQILSFSSENNKTKIDKLLEIYNLLLDSKKRLTGNSCLSILATLIFINVNSKELVNDIVDVDKYLGCQKGVGLWLYGKTTRLFFAILIVASFYEKKNRSDLKNTSLISYVVTEDLLLSIAIFNLLVVMD